MRDLRLFTAVLLAGGLFTGPALARHHHHHSTAVTMNVQGDVSGTHGNLTNNPNANTANNSAALADADRLLQNASGVITNMQQSGANIVNLMSRAKAVFIIPNSGSVSSGGVLLTNKNGRWSNPVFFNMGGGASAVQPAANGATANTGAVNSGPVALLIMSNRAMSRFQSRGNFSLTPSAKFNITNYSPNMTSQAPQPSSRSTGDIIIWSGANGANMSVAPSFTQVSANALYNQTIYGTANMRQIVAGRAPLTNQLAVNLRTQLPAGEPATRVGTREMTTRPG